MSPLGTSRHIFLLVVFVVCAMSASVMYGPHLSMVAGLFQPNLAGGVRTLAGAFFIESKSIAELQTTYAAVPDTGRRVRILIVPGHEPSFGGTQHQGLLERDIVVDMAEELQRLLQGDPRYSVMVARSREAWHPSLERYFAVHKDDILDFREGHKQQMGRLLKQGLLSQVTGVSHNSAPRDVALRLYGINAWANEQEVDLVLHVHINDHERRSTRTQGVYSGFSIYVPERQYSNSTSSRAVADSLYRRLSHSMPVSDMPLEQSGVVEDQELVAIGRYNTVDAPSMLIEYGYIYEGHFHDQTMRELLTDEYAYLTFRGVQDFFSATIATSTSFETTLLPHTWSVDVESGMAPLQDVLALQAALRSEGLYPPPGRTLHQCPLAGVFRKCTQTALAAFQEKYGVHGEVNQVGPQTRAVLNQRYGREHIEE